MIFDTSNQRDRIPPTLSKHSTYSMLVMVGCVFSKPCFKSFPPWLCCWIWLPGLSNNTHKIITNLNRNHGNLYTWRSEASFLKWSYLNDCFERGSKNLPPPLSLCSVTKDGILALGSLTGVSWSLLYRAKAPATPSFNSVSLFNNTRTSTTRNSFKKTAARTNPLWNKQTCENFVEFTRRGVSYKIWSYTDLERKKKEELNN